MNPTSRLGADAALDDDIKVLHGMGYAQELARRLSHFSNFAISFSIICILSGGINSLAQATSGAGGAAIGLGWPLGVLISGVFGLAMAQIASTYPTAGRLYHWGSSRQSIHRMAHGLVQFTGSRDRAGGDQRRHLLFLSRCVWRDAWHRRFDDHAPDVSHAPDRSTSS